MKIPLRPIALGLVALLFSGVLLERAQAGGGHFFPPVADPLVREECGSCHLAFAPSMLPKSSWTRMMGDLKNHFGDDASIDVAKTERITRYLNANAADSGGQRNGGKLLRGVSMGNAPLRITELPRWITELPRWITELPRWITELPRWISEHCGISAAEWKSKKVGS